MDLSHFHWQEFIAGGVFMTLLAYAVRTIPPQTNPWARWLVGILQFAVSNLEQARAQVKPPDTLK